MYHFTVNFTNGKLCYNITQQCCETADIFLMDKNNKCIVCKYPKEIVSILSDVFPELIVECVLFHHGGEKNLNQTELSLDFYIQKFTRTEHTDFTNIPLDNCACTKFISELMDLMDTDESCYIDTQCSILQTTFTNRQGCTITAIAYNYSNGYYAHEFKLFINDKKGYHTWI